MIENIYASLPTAEAASQAVGALIDHGIKPQYLSILMKSIPEADAEAKSMASDEATGIREHAEHGVTFTTAGDAKVGAVKGAGFGLGLGTVAAIASVAIPGFGLVLGGGALAIAIAGMVGTTAAGAMAGAVTGYMVDQGVKPEHVDVFAKAIEAGGALVGVSCPSEDATPNEIADIFRKYGGTVQHTSLVSH